MWSNTIIYNILCLHLRSWACPQTLPQRGAWKRARGQSNLEGAEGYCVQCTVLRVGTCCRHSKTGCTLGWWSTTVLRGWKLTARLLSTGVEICVDTAVNRSMHFCHAYFLGHGVSQPVGWGGGGGGSVVLLDCPEGAQNGAEQSALLWLPRVLPQTVLSCPIPRVCLPYSDFMCFPCCCWASLLCAAARCSHMQMRQEGFQQPPMYLYGRLSYPLMSQCCNRRRSAEASVQASVEHLHL